MFTVLSEIHIPADADKRYSDNDTEPGFYRPGLPVVSFRFTDEIKKKYPHVKQAWVQSQLRAIGWIVPNYALPKDCEDTEILRVVVRESLNGELGRRLVRDIIEVTEGLLNDEGPSYTMSKAVKRPVHKREHEEHRGHNNVC